MTVLGQARIKDMAMELCSFYKEIETWIKSEEIRPRSQNDGDRRVVIPWCDHPKHSPALRKVVVLTLAGARQLQCGGDLMRCQVPAADFGNIT